MNYLDIILMIPVLWFAYKGFKKGLVIEIASLAALVLGIYAAFHFSGFTENILKEKFKMETEYIHVIAFAVTFVVVVLLTRLVGNLVEAVLNLTILGFFNNIAGAVFGALKIALIISALFYIIQGASPSGGLFSKETKEKSMLYEPVSSLVYILLPKVRQVEWKEYKPGSQENKPEKDSVDVK